MMVILQKKFHRLKIQMDIAHGTFTDSSLCGHLLVSDL